MRQKPRLIACAAILLTIVPIAVTQSSARSRKAKKPNPTPAVEQVAPSTADTKAGAQADSRRPGATPPAQGAGASAAGVTSPTDAPANAAAAAAAGTATPKAAPKWTDEQVAAAKAHCTEVLARINAVSIPHEPIKEGACGAPAPIELIRIGKNPEVSLSPTAVVTCDLAETLAKWLEEDLQPLAREHLKSEIIKIDTMSSYACRNAYGRKTTFLSEHAVANALDIGDFVTATAKTASVLQGWGTPQREVLAKLAAEKAAAEKLAAEKAAADKAAQTNLTADKGHPSKSAPPQATASTLGAPAVGIARSSIIDGIPKLTVTLPGSAGKETSLSIAEPDRLGGPKHADKAVVSERPKKRRRNADVTAVSQMDPADPEVTAFLHEAHKAACVRFGTTLGPEANSDHRNHFHVDMAPRKYKKICD